MKSLRESLLDIGFSKKPKNIMDLNIFKDYRMQFMPEKKWDDTAWIYFYFMSKGFAKVMQFLFLNHESMCNQYMPRKLRKDNEDGCLGMALISCDKMDDGDFLFESGFFKMKLSEIPLVLERCKAPDEMFYVMYNGIGNLLAFIEGPWVFLYMCCERGMSMLDIEKEINNASEDITKKWRLYKPIDSEIINLFKSVYSMVRKDC